MTDEGVLRHTVPELLDKVRQWLEVAGERKDVEIDYEDEVIVMKDCPDMPIAVELVDYLYDCPTAGIKRIHGEPSYKHRGIQARTAYGPGLQRPRYLTNDHRD